jgi:hypothetical protein
MSEQRAHWSIYVITVLVVAAIGWVALGGEQNLFSTSPAPLLVEIKSVVLSRQDEGPPSYFYTVTLPDGTAAPYRSSRMYRVGDRVTVLYSRGNLTGRVLLTTPAVDTERARDRR